MLRYSGKLPQNLAKSRAEQFGKKSFLLQAGAGNQGDLPESVVGSDTRVADCSRRFFGPVQVPTGFFADQFEVGALTIEVKVTQVIAE